jgi:hypothetical protein
VCVVCALISIPATAEGCAAACVKNWLGYGLVCGVHYKRYIAKPGSGHGALYIGATWIFGQCTFCL